MPDSSTAANREKMLDIAIGPVPDWGMACVEDTMATLKSDTELFPCVFAVAAAHRGGLRFGFVDDVHDERTWTALPDILATYLAGYRQISRETSLVVFFGSPDERSDAMGPAGSEHPNASTAPAVGVDTYEDRFWSLLQYLHDNDTSPWPSDIPTDTDDPGWEFSFRGTPIFVVCNTPAHRRLRSRNNPTFTVTFQPRWVFEGLGATTPRGTSSRRIIRDRLARFDAVDSTPLLGSYGDPENREWKQYFLRDDASVGDRCPFLGNADRVPAGNRLSGSTAIPTPTEKLFKVVVNHEDQYSVWPQDRRNALGWFDTSVVGTRQECLDSVALTWTDMRPRRLRRKMAMAAEAARASAATSQPRESVSA
ncbi:YqcI/YcgG family protein [Frankia gtarii]|uniref:YqcI/YcgG family protein n=1 Tax=Frankia gtarii TaxID=2950102 RepID=UPI0021C0E0DE|nr:YqcI/YcgG family protein [Frankia gtarii]